MGGHLLVAWCLLFSDLGNVQWHFRLNELTLVGGECSSGHSSEERLSRAIHSHHHHVVSLMSYP